MFPEWTWMIGLLVGAAIGSFLNVVIYRMPRDMSLGNPKHSFCPNCNHQLGMVDLVPLFSWLIQGGKCRYCAAKIPPRYFFVELITGIFWAVIWYQFMVLGEDWQRAIAYMLAAATLVAVSWIDWESYTIPDALNATLLIIGVAYHAVAGSLQQSLIGALLGWGLLFGIGLLGRLLFGKDAMGEGDVLLMRGVGALIGPWPLVFAVGVAVALGAVHGLTVMAIDAGRKRKDPQAGDDEPPPPAQPIGQMLLIGLLMLLCIDVFALFFKPVANWLERMMPEAAGLSDEAWEPPSIRYIPFGPFLAAGTVAVLLFEPHVNNLIQNYLKQFSPPPV
jgi:leader peptidase (prepilin peptidase)/N-methyltransferase